MKRSIPILLALAACLATAPGAPAQPVDVPPTWGGDLSSRPRLTGSWGGLRDELGKKGVVLDVDVMGTPQGVLSGGRDTGWDIWGASEYTLHVDTQKLGLWPGGFLKVYGMSSFGHSVNQRTGAILPVNTATLVPAVNDPTSALMSATFMQFLSPKFGLVAGKIYTLNLMEGEFTGDYHTQFMNTGFVFPSTMGLVPIAAYGGGVIALPWEGVVLSAMALDPSGSPTNNDLNKLFSDGVTVLANGQVTIKPFGLVGHQNLGFMWSNKDRLSLQQDPSNLARLALDERFPRLGDPGPVLRRILERFFPALLVPAQPANRVENAWAVFYSFDQYLWNPEGDPKRGIGPFFQFSISDGVANPVKYYYSVGIGGKGVVPRRPLDTFGIGWARTEFSNNFVPFLRQQLGLGLNREDAVEMYYNASITRWLNASLDFQIIDTGLKKTLDSSNRLTDMDTAVVAGIRLYTRF
jgi:porin